MTTPRLVLRTCNPEQDGKPRPAEGDHAAVRIDAHQHSSLAFDHVAVGGTFDRDKLLEKKKHFELLEPYDQRAAAADSYIKSVRPALTVQTGALLDPKEPTAAATEEGMQALVVSKETVSGGEAINQYRREHGFAPLELVVVDLWQTAPLWRAARSALLLCASRMLLQLAAEQQIP
ncbi:probable phosphopantetheine adenylyltransferase [Coccomyxa sp. Obi]|nr:probable phosphopantetheine adenylyltransferase [Coccomyxa sp. Obi]